MRDFSSHYSALEGVDTRCSSSNKRKRSSVAINSVYEEHDRARVNALKNEQQ